MTDDNGGVTTHPPSADVITTPLQDVPLANTGVVEDDITTAPLIDPQPDVRKGVKDPPMEGPPPHLTDDEVRGQMPNLMTGWDRMSRMELLVVLRLRCVYMTSKECAHCMGREP